MVDVVDFVEYEQSRQFVPLSCSARCTRVAFPQRRPYIATQTGSTASRVASDGAFPPGHRLRVWLRGRRLSIIMVLTTGSSLLRYTRRCAAPRLARTSARTAG